MQWLLTLPPLPHHQISKPCTAGLALVRPFPHSWIRSQLWCSLLVRSGPSQAIPMQLDWAPAGPLLHTRSGLWTRSSLQTYLAPLKQSMGSKSLGTTGLVWLALMNFCCSFCCVWVLFKLLCARKLNPGIGFKSVCMQGESCCINLFSSCYIIANLISRNL